MDFSIYNGKIVSKNEIQLNDLVSDNFIQFNQKIWFGYGGIPLLTENIESIKKQLETIHLPLPGLFQNKRELYRLTKRMLNKNRFYRSGWITVQLFIGKHHLDSIITSESSDIFHFPMHEKGLLVAPSPVRKTSRNEFNRYKCHNQMFWRVVSAGSNDDGFVILNDRGNICEGLASNIFMIKDNVLITPSLSTGCYEDVIRTEVLKTGEKMNMKIIETNELRSEHLFQMDEIFFACEDAGIQWILGLENKRFVHQTTDNIADSFNTYLQTQTTVKT